ncbi:MAG: A24 family peptidase [Bdellovibrionales bacterium]|nr:A24 family peptidase [Bdellovibrionales bacterium]
MNWAAEVPLAIILGIGVIEDLRTKKVRNALILAMAGVVTVGLLFIGGLPILGQGFLGLTTAFILTLPLVLVGAMGAGDMKLLMVFGLASDWGTVLETFLLSLVWGCIIGVFKIVASSQVRQTLYNMYGFINKNFRAPKTAMTHIPYTVAYLMGWISLVTVRFYGVSLW